MPDTARVQEAGVVEAAFQDAPSASQAGLHVEARITGYVRATHTFEQVSGYVLPMHLYVKTYRCMMKRSPLTCERGGVSGTSAVRRHLVVDSGCTRSRSVLERVPLTAGSMDCWQLQLRQSPMPCRRRRNPLVAWPSDHSPSRVNPRWTSGCHGLYRHSRGLQDSTRSPGSYVQYRIELGIAFETPGCPLYPANWSRYTAPSRAPH